MKQFLIYPLSTLMTLDVLTTVIGLSKGLVEGNPLISGLYSTLPFSLFVVIFLLIKVGVLGAVYMLYKYTKMDMVLLVGTGISLIVLINNLSLLL
ncbi:DUF5658 family protein [Sulfolobus acidocaldarius]|uniref:DUF5658 domain-containing protein n=4 Tax=Sulfolobus acidocaldarius TaxID=2285 RepID=A0A0U3FSN3_9CREN|nr:DUF5658 family protein [Sulfolobus acidocaldarius]AAY81059.1 hypothetical SSV1 ORF C-102A membrane-like protein [Sulfolobus acidocaldarius DSM 639]AGE73939.1 hypothetical protein SacRon12I_08540 [Sulfolobus acidocaldarius Ron12/I]ALU30120.1 hypothetical protein ATY89_09365 [Sulfolobus acidocaldarius]ALU30814.1 hypothetical protein ATZ20_00775 [Sulfolobus acidocaldarius]WCM35567.1 hypothetical protein GO597_09595 [Sulfolobus acidocaldarius DSM 639]